MIMDLTLPALPLPGFVLLPGCTVTLQIGPEPLQQQLELAKSYHHRVCVAADQNPNFGCLAEIRALHRNAAGVQVKLAGIKRLRLFLQLRGEDGVLWVGNPLTDSVFQGELPALPVGKAIAELKDRVPAGLWLDMAAFHLPLPAAAKEALLAEPDVERRLAMLAGLPLEAAAASRPQPCLN